MSMLTTLLLTDAINKGGPGSGPQSGKGLAPFGNHVGKRVTVNSPGHPMHGKTGNIIRQMGNESAVDFRGDSASWIKTEHLHQA